MNSRAALLLFCACALPGLVWAQSVVLSGVLGNKALLVVDGAPPKGVGVNEIHRGVKVLSTQGNQAEIEIDGKRQTLRLGEGPVTAAPGSPETGGRRIVLHAGSHGHFRTQGQINGKTVTFMVDTGASAVSIGAAEADAIGIQYKNGERVLLNTANGQSIGWKVQLNSVRLGSVDVYSVEALVTPAPMPYVLLGNSYLTRFQMTRTNDQLLLEQRY